MVNLLQNAVAVAHAAVRTVAGEPITYTRGGISIEIPDAVRGFTSWDRDAPFNGVRVGDRSTDWQIAAARLIDADGNTLGDPQRDDKITTADGTTFRVLPFGPDKQFWQWHDRQGRSIYRIHTKERSA